MQAGQEGSLSGILPAMPLCCACLVAVMAVVAVGCDFGALSRPCPDPGSRGTLTAVIAGAPFAACTATVAGAAGDDGEVIITGLSGELVPTQLILTTQVGAPGTVTLGGSGDNSGLVVRTELDASYATSAEASGSLTFSRLDEEQAVGTFTFEAAKPTDAADVIEVTDGVFDLAF